MTAYNPAEVERLIAEARAFCSRDRQGLREALADQLEAARAEVERLRSQAEFAERADEHKSQVIADLQRDLDRITGYHRTKQEECAELEAAMKKSQALRWDLTAEREAARAEIERLTGLVDDWSTSSVLTGEERDRLRHDLELARADAQTARKAWAERDAARAEADKLRARVAGLEKLAATADRAIASLQQQGEQARARIAELETAARDRANDLTAPASTSPA